MNIVEKISFLPPKPLFHKKIKYIQNTKGTIPFIHIKKKKSPFTIIFSHGNNTDLGRAYDVIKWISKKLNVSVIGYDYFGYGFSKSNQTFLSSIISKPTEKGCYDSINIVYEYLKSLGEKNIVLFGNSIGTGPTIELASKKNDILGVILMSPFTSITKIGINTNCFSFMDIFKNDIKIHNITCKVFIIHGYNDKLIPVEHAIDLYALLHQDSKYPPHFNEKYGHNEMYNNEVIEHIVTFMSKII